MPDTITALAPVLQSLASTAGAGIAAYYVLNAVRQQVPPLPAGKVATLPRGELFVYNALYQPFRARVLVFVLTALISLAATALLAYLTGGDVFNATDAAIAVIVAQLWHGWKDLPSDALYAPDRRMAGWQRQDEDAFHAE